MEPVFSVSDISNKVSSYREFIPMLKSYLEAEDDRISLLANASAALKECFGWFWVGFYLVDQDETLHVGPFQGTAACSRIRHGKGVCGTAWAQASSIVVPDVDSFPGHIACASASRSEIVVPMIHNGIVIGILDIDSTELNTFDETDRVYLEEIVAFLTEKYVVSK